MLAFQVSNLHNGSERRLVLGIYRSKAGCGICLWLSFGDGSVEVNDMAGKWGGGYKRGW